MRESLRLGPTAPARTVGSVEDTVIGGKYAVEKGTPIIVNIYSMHRDPKIWGEDVRVFLTVHHAVVHSAPVITVAASLWILLSLLMCSALWYLP